MGQKRILKAKDQLRYKRLTVKVGDKKEASSKSNFHCMYLSFIMRKNGPLKEISIFKK